MRSGAIAAALAATALLLCTTPVVSAAGGEDLVAVRSAVLETRGVLSLSAGGTYYESLDLVEQLDGVEDAGRYVDLRLSASYGVTTWLELGVDVPFRRAGWDASSGSAPEASGLDNPVVGLKLAIPLRSRVLSLAVSARGGIPISQEFAVESDAGEGSEIFLGGGTRTDAELVLLATADFTRSLPLRLHANVGWAFRREDDRGRRFYPDYYMSLAEGAGAFDNDTAILRGAVEFPGRRVTLFSEFRGDIAYDREAVALKENPLSVTPGIRVAVGGGWSATAAMTVAISGDDGGTPDFDPHEAYPDWVATFSLSYSRPVSAADTDADGIPDFRDGCPRAAEDADGFEDDDGCPDYDNDADGVPDELDGAPDLPEDFDGFEDEDGVPDLDNDGDGIVDERDMCPDHREDLDGFEDEDGCPDD